MFRRFKTAAFAVATTVLMASGASAQQAPTADQAYADIKATLGGVPSHMQGYPRSAIAGAWLMTKGLLMGEENTLDPKTKSLIALAVAAQIPCEYCIWFETRSAKQAGASQEQVAEAVAVAAYTRHWSTVLNGLQIDLDTFKAEFGGE